MRRQMYNDNLMSFNHSKQMLMKYTRHEARVVIVVISMSHYRSAQLGSDLTGDVIIT